jgi:type I restriction enzyme S subunit
MNQVNDKLDVHLPHGWQSCSGRDLFPFVTSGSRGWARFYSESGPIFLRVGNLNHASIRLDLTDVQRVAPPPGQEAKRTKVRPGDILISVTADVGMVAVVPEAFEEAHINQHVALCRTNHAVDKEYVAWFLSSESGGLKQFRQLQRGATKQGLGLNDIFAVTVPLAPLAEQRRIVAKIEELLSDLDAGVVALERAKANLKRYRAAVLKAAVEGKLTEAWRAEHPDVEPASKLLERILTERRQKWESTQRAKFAAANKEPPKNWKSKYAEPAPPDSTKLPDLPDGWCCASVEQLTALVTKGSSPGWQGFDYVDSGVIFVRSQNVRWGNVDLSDVAFLPPSFNDTHQNSIIRTGDVLLNLVGASIGRSAIAPPELDGANTNQAVGIIRLVKNGLRNDLLVNLLLSPQLQNYIAKTKADVARANFNLDDVRPTPIPLPPESEQLLIVREVEERISQIDAAETEIDHGLARAARLRQSILKQAFEGKLVPQDPTDEPAGVLIERLRASQRSNETNGKSRSSARGRTPRKKSKTVAKE